MPRLKTARKRAAKQEPPPSLAARSHFLAFILKMVLMLLMW